MLIADGALGVEIAIGVAGHGGFRCFDQFAKGGIIGDARIARAGSSRYLVEPNVKEGKGGLRDLNTLFWIAKYVYRVRDVEELTGVKREDALRDYSRILISVVEEDRGLVLEAIETSARSMKPYVVEYRVRGGVGWSTADCLTGEARWSARNFMVSSQPWFATSYRIRAWPG